jgi:ABC-type polysaccharide/polyol phosphate transport system ATPase subunit
MMQQFSATARYIPLKYAYTSYGGGPLAEIHQFTKVEFKRFKALNNFTLNLRHFNILVGPNNAGKSTVLAAFRILAAALRKAGAKSAEVIS